MKRSSGVASGVLMLLAGAFLVLRTVRRPDGGHNLVDLILGGNGAAEASAAAASGQKANDLLKLPSLTRTPQTSSPTRGRTTTTQAASKTIRDSR
ncbi:MAG TPA: hypothetical protein VN962_05395 [Polyangia bacterium]|nr:hypothetical protein [Polyangia bacterium]